MTIRSYDRAPRPTMATRRAFLRDWNLQQRKPGSKWVHLQGRVYGHPKFYDGELVTTSPVMMIDFHAGVAETMNTIYMLNIDEG